MMRGFSTAWLLGSLLLSGVGCTKTVFFSKEDINRATQLGNLSLENDQDITVRPGLTGAVDTPPNIVDADRPPRHITLQEAIALALENGGTNDRFPGNSENFPNFTGAGSLVGQSDAIRVLAYQPAIAGANLEASQARFDAIIANTATWGATDQLQQGLQSFQNGSTGSFSTTLAKPNAYGGVANITFSADYRDLRSPPLGQFGVLNPQYTTRAIFGYEQPLLRDFGPEINQLLNRFPGIAGGGMPAAAAGAINGRFVSSGQSPTFSNLNQEGILITRIRLDQQKAEFERNVNNLLLNVETAYWRLYQAYGQLYTFEEVERIAHKVWMNYDVKVKAGQKSVAEFAPVRGQLEEFKGERVKALSSVLDAERVLRGIMGLPVEDGTRLVPITPPTLAPYQPNWEAAFNDALQYRPELFQARENLRLAQLNIVTIRNFLRPDLRFFAQYSPVGFGTDLDGNGTFIDGTGTQRTSNALRSLSSDHFNDYTIGLNYIVTLGSRNEYAQMRSAKLSLAQSYELLKDNERRAVRNLYLNYLKLSEWYGRIEAARAERKAYGEGVKARFQELEIGRATVADGLLEVQRRFAAAMAKEFEAIAEYNSTLSRFEHSKGTIMNFNNILIQEGALPDCVQVRAVEHERERAKALVLRERPSPQTTPGRLVGDPTGVPHTDLNADPAILPPGVDGANNAGAVENKLPFSRMPNTLERSTNSPPVATISGTPTDLSALPPPPAASTPYGVINR